MGASMLDQDAQRLAGDRIDGVVIGTYIGTRSDMALVSHSRSGPDAPLRARALVDLRTLSEGDAVALAFEAGDASRPIILGRLEGPRMPVQTGSDGCPERLEITGRDEVTIRCGKASITLTREGKIILRGTYVSSRSSGVNRIKGGSVQIN